METIGKTYPQPLDSKTSQSGAGSDGSSSNGLLLVLFLCVPVPFFPGLNQPLGFRMETKSPVGPWEKASEMMVRPTSCKTTPKLC